MLLSTVNFFHVLCGVSFLGITIAAFFYIARSLHQQDRPLINYSIKTSYVGDIFILLCIIIQISSSIQLVSARHYTLDIPWIFMAYLAFGIIVSFWLFNIIIKAYYLSKTVIQPLAIKGFYFVNIVMILLYIMIIHDAVAHNSWFGFLFGK